MDQMSTSTFPLLVSASLCRSPSARALSGIKIHDRRLSALIELLLTGRAVVGRPGRQTNPPRRPPPPSPIRPELRSSTKNCATPAQLKGTGCCAAWTAPATPTVSPPRVVKSPCFFVFHKTPLRPLATGRYPPPPRSPSPARPASLEAPYHRADTPLTDRDLLAADLSVAIGLNC